MRRPAALLLVVALAALPAACREDALAVEADAVRVEAAADHLVVTNGRHESIHYFARFEDAAIVDWAPCTSAACPSLPAQSITRLSYSEVAGGSGSSILFHWWTAVRAPGNGTVAGPVNTLRIRR